MIVWKYVKKAKKSTANCSGVFPGGFWPMQGPVSFEKSLCRHQACR